MKFRPTKAQRRRCEQLATYLENLPEDYREFNMMDFILDQSTDETLKDYALHNGGVTKCGSAACAVGHGPAAGIYVPRSMITTGMYGDLKIDWFGYAKKFTGNESNDEFFEWMFGGAWARFDNHHYGAAARIRYALDKQPIEEGFYAGNADSSILDQYRRYDKRYAS